jgi:two-component system LytT family response regulator
MLRILLVDDEPPACRHLAELLSAFPDTTVAGTAHSVAAARPLLRSLSPDIVFLDMEMPGEQGLALVPALSAGTRLVFVTGHTDYAIRAFTLGAVDYLLKPVDRDRLAITMERLLPRSFPVPPAPPGGTLLSAKYRESAFLNPSSIAWISALQNYTRVQTTLGRATVFRRTLSDWLAELPTGRFHQLDRSTVIHLPLLRSVRWISRDSSFLTFEGVPDPLPIGRTAASRLREIIRAT